MTAAALLAFVRAGHTTRAGHYRRQLAKALKWLLGAQASGAAAQARAQALAELATVIGDAGLAADRPGRPRPICRPQTRRRQARSPRSMRCVRRR